MGLTLDASTEIEELEVQTPAAAAELEASLAVNKDGADKDLEETLMRELLAQRKPRNKPVAKSAVIKNAIAQ